MWEGWEGGIVTANTCPHVDQIQKLFCKDVKFPSIKLNRGSTTKTRKQTAIKYLASNILVKSKEDYDLMVTG